MNFPNNHKKSIAAFLILFALLALAGGLLVPQKPAKALNATLVQQIIQFIMDKVSWAKDYAKQLEQELSLSTIEEIQEWFKDDTLERRDQRESWNEDRKELLDELVNDIIQEMQDMGDGETAFVDDWRDYLQDPVLEATQDFADNVLGTGNMCESFDQEIKEIFTEEAKDPAEKFEELTQCPVDNEEPFFDDFSEGGWETWIQMFEPGGNYYETLLLTHDELMRIQGETYDAEKSKLMANEGFRGTEETPGIIQSYAAQRASMMDLDYLLNSDELETYFGSVADAFINRIFEEGLSLMGTDDYQQTQPPPDYPPAVDPEEETTTSVESDIQLKNALDQALSEAMSQLEELLGVQQENLEVLQEIQALQTECGVSTQNSTEEINYINGAIAETQEVIGLIQQAIDDFNALIPIMEDVLDAYDSGDQAALDAALDAYAEPYQTLISDVNQITGESSSDFASMIENLGNFIADSTDQLNIYLERLGTESGSICQVNEYLSTLYSWLQCLNVCCLDMCQPLF